MLSSISFFVSPSLGDFKNKFSKGMRRRLKLAPVFKGGRRVQQGLPSVTVLWMFADVFSIVFIVKFGCVCV